MADPNGTQRDRANTVVDGPKHVLSMKMGAQDLIDKLNENFADVSAKYAELRRDYNQLLERMEAGK